LSTSLQFPEHEVPANGGERRTTCASCGRQVATGARYCIHCGAEQSVPTPIAAVAAASIARRPGREAANAAHADPAHASAPDAAPDSHDGALPPFGVTGTAHAANSDQPARPAYADAPRRRGLAVAVVAGLVAVTIIVVLAIVWRISGEPESVMTANTPNETAPKHARAQAAAPAAEQPGTSTATPAAAPGTTQPATTPETTSPEAAQPPSPTSAAGADVPVEIKPLPPHPSIASRPAHRAQPPKPASTTTTTAQSPEPPAEPVPPKVVQAPTPVHRAAAPAAARAVDRWQRLDDELARCTREDFITRVICGQRVRFRYCDGYWGKVPQCPGNTNTPDRGQ